MALYQWTNDELRPIPETSFESEHILERDDLQRVLRDQPEVLEDGLFIIAEEFSNWEESGRSIDLLALDNGGRLVVIELKRDVRGAHMELQSIRYAAMVSNMTFEQAVTAHQNYLDWRGINEEARTRISEYLEASGQDEAVIDTQRPRIILASAGFSKELTTSVLWLNEIGLDITCIRLQLHRTDQGLLLETSQIIPLPEALDYLVRVREKENEAERQRPRQSSPTPGADVFKQSIEFASQEDKPMLERMYRWAVALEEEGLARLFSKSSTTMTSLHIRLLHSNSGLVNMHNYPPRGWHIDLWASVFQRNAPDSIGPIEEVIGKPLGSQKSHRDVTDELLERLRDAYREANDEGQSSLTPAPTREEEE